MGSDDLSDLAHDDHGDAFLKHLRDDKGERADGELDIADDDRDLEQSESKTIRKYKVVAELSSRTETSDGVHYVRERIARERLESLERRKKT